MIMFVPQNSSRDSKELSQQGTGCSSKNQQRADLVITWYETTACFFNFSINYANLYIFKGGTRPDWHAMPYSLRGAKNTKVRKSSLRARHTAGFCVTYRKYALFASSKVPSSRF